MQLKLFTNKSEPNRVTKDLTEVVTFDGTLRDSCSILNPVIVVSEFNNDMAVRCNYAFLPEFARYYYITDAICIANNLWELHMRVDVLQTYAAQIKQQTAIINRQEKRNNMLLNDALFNQQQDRMIQLKEIPCAFNEVHYILIVAGG